MKNITSLANTLKFLSVDSISNAKSGHPGICLGIADTLAVLFTNHLKFNPNDSKWLNRDRFVLSAGHGSALLYSILHLFGYDISLNDLKNFRKLNSKTPGHPEYGIDGVELTTGPLGQGLASSVGFAIVQKALQARYPDIFDYKIFTLVGDGCLYEGVSQEAISLAGHLKLDNFIILYDDNDVTLDGFSKKTISEDKKLKFESMGWDVFLVDGYNLKEIDSVLTLAKESRSKKPKIIMVKTIIGKGSVYEGTNAVHGAPLKKEDIENIKKSCNYPLEEFFISDEVLKFCKQINEKNKKEYENWQRLFSDYESKNIDFLKENLDDIDIPYYDKEKSISGRDVYNQFLERVYQDRKFILGGSPDSSASDKSRPKNAVDFQADNYLGNYINYGIREHAMGSIINGINIDGLFRAYGGGFFVFCDYMRGSMRIASLSHYPSLFIYSHDSIAVGEDGPTHQPIEHFASLRAIPNMLFFRPSDPNETIDALNFAFSYKKNPITMVLSKQNIPVLELNNSKEKISKGAYVVRKDKNPKILLIATGSDLVLAISAYEEMKNKIAMQVISMPCMKLFENQDKKYKDEVIPKSIRKRVIVESGIKMSFFEYLTEETEFIGLKSFGYSGPTSDVFLKMGMSKENILKAIDKLSK